MHSVGFSDSGSELYNIGSLYSREVVTIIEAAFDRFAHDTSTSHDPGLAAEDC